MTAKKGQPSWSFEKDFNFPAELGNDLLPFPSKDTKQNFEKIYQFNGKDKLRKIQSFIEKNDGESLKKFAVISHDYNSFVLKISCKDQTACNFFDKEISKILCDQGEEFEDFNFEKMVGLKSDQEEMFPLKNEKIISSLDFHLAVKEEEKKKNRSVEVEDGDDKKNDYFFKVRNHQDFYKVGNSYYEDFKFGIKNFSFFGVGKDKKAYDTVIGVTSFINYYEKKSALIISNSMKDELRFEEGWKEVEKEFSTPSMSKFKIHFYQMGKMFVMNYDELMTLRSKLSGPSFQIFLEEFSELFNLVVWELPSLEEMSSKNEFYFPLCVSMESVSLILSLGENRSREVEKAINFFQKYGVKIKGFLLDHSGAQKN